MPFQILFRDDALYAINKPAWWVVHRGLARDAEVVVDVLKKQLSQEKIYPLHRLDRQTSGVLMFAANRDVARAMQQRFDEKQIQKEYLALVRGRCPNSGLIDAPVPKNENGERVAAQTRYTRICSCDTEPRAVSLVKVLPLSGRFHQIRRHLKHINHPIIGDSNYGKGKLNRAFKEQYGLNRMALHASTISFIHPISMENISIIAPLPDDLRMPFARMGINRDTAA